MAGDFAVSAADSVTFAVVETLRSSASRGRLGATACNCLETNLRSLRLSPAMRSPHFQIFRLNRAPQGSTFGVSAFQINFGSTSIETAGDEPDMLIAMNPAALKVNLADLRPGGLIIVDEGAFGERNCGRRAIPPSVAKLNARAIRSGRTGHYASYPRRGEVDGERVP